MLKYRVLLRIWYTATLLLHVYIFATSWHAFYTHICNCTFNVCLNAQYYLYRNGRKQQQQKLNKIALALLVYFIDSRWPTAACVHFIFLNWTLIKATTKQHISVCNVFSWNVSVHHTERIMWVWQCNFYCYRQCSRCFGWSHCWCCRCCCCCGGLPWMWLLVFLQHDFDRKIAHQIYREASFLRIGCGAPLFVNAIHGMSYCGMPPGRGTVFAAKIAQSTGECHENLSKCEKYCAATMNTMMMMLFNPHIVGYWWWPQFAYYLCINANAFSNFVFITTLRMDAALPTWMIVGRLRFGAYIDCCYCIAINHPAMGKCSCAHKSTRRGVMYASRVLKLRSWK